MRNLLALSAGTQKTFKNGEPKRRPAPDHPDVFLFDVVRRDRRPLSVAWEKRGVFSGEDAPPTPLELKVAKGQIALSVSVTPIWIEP
jgi:hypothetical protein